MPPIYVIPNPDKRPNGHALQVINPLTGKAFSAEPTELDAAALANPRIRRLLPPDGQPGGVPGGRDSDLVPAPRAPRKPKSGRQTETPED